MRLKFLAISDTHLGEETSILSFPHGRQHLWRVLRPPFGSDVFDANNKEKLEIDEMILMGDIPDRTLSSTSQIITHTNDFVGMLGSLAKIKKGIYIPGNHDHTIWTGYQGGVTKPEGEIIIGPDNYPDEKSVDEKSESLLTTFFGFPHGSAWRKITEENSLEFALSNPIYVNQFKGRTYVFAHGTHFRNDVTSPEWIKKVADYLEADKVLGNIEIQSDCNVNEAKSLEELEKIVSPFVDSLWPSSKNNPTSQSDQLWYLLTRLSGKFGKHRKAPEKSDCFSSKRLPEVCESRIKRLTKKDDSIKEDDSIKRWEKYFIPHLLDYLRRHQIPKDNITFVYGDTHDGGWGKMQLDSGENIRVYNSGGWVVHNKEDHPACHLFAVDEDGEEYLVDVSFKNVKVEGTSILELAAEDAENRSQKIDIGLRLLSRILSYIA